jgi:hypothetical protein
MNLARACREWQKILRLEDWRIRARWVDGMDMPNDSGDTQYLLVKKQAEIRIARPNGHGHDSIAVVTEGIDPEVDLVHELLHLHFAPFEGNTGSPELTAQEQAIHAISTALVELKHADHS